MEPLRFCLSHTECKLIILDTERADTLEPAASNIMRDTAAIGFLVFDSHEGKGFWRGMSCFRTVVQQFNGPVLDILEADPQMLPEDDAAIMFTSGASLSRISFRNDQR